jgi:phenylalanine-4-hydroxylase
VNYLKWHKLESTLVDCGIWLGTLDNPKIYGAGLLSSIGESAWCMTDEVQKLPYSIDAHAFDITATTLHLILLI